MLAVCCRSLRCSWWSGRRRWGRRDDGRRGAGGSTPSPSCQPPPGSPRVAPCWPSEVYVWSGWADASPESSGTSDAMPSVVDWVSEPRWKWLATCASAIGTFFAGNLPRKHGKSVIFLYVYERRELDSTPFDELQGVGCFLRRENDALYKDW